MILVTGATGFVGRHVVKALRTQNKEVRCLVHSSPNLEAIKSYDVDLTYGNILDLTSLQNAMRGVDTVIHLVAIIQENHGAKFDLVNRVGTELVVNAARAEGVRRLIHMSALGAQDDSSYPYLYSKWQGDQAVIKSGLSYTILRPSIQFGPGDQFINILAGLAKALPIVPVIGSGKVRFQPIFVEDVGAMVSLMVDDPYFDGRIIDVGGPNYLTYNEIVDIIIKTLKRTRLKIHLSLPLMRLFTRAIEALIPKPTVTASQLELLSLDNITSVDTVSRILKTQPRPLKGNIDYIHQISYLDAWKIILGFVPQHIRDH